MSAGERQSSSRENRLFELQKHCLRRQYRISTSLSVVALVWSVSFTSSAGGSLSDIWKDLTTKMEIRMQMIPGGTAASMPLDANNDGTDEILCISPKLFHFLSLDHWKYTHSVWNDKLMSVVPLHIDSDSLPDYVISELDSITLRLRVMTGRELLASARGSTVICEKQISWYKGESRGVVSPFAAYDINNDGIRDIICSTSTGAFGKQPRGVVAIDGANGKELWQNLFGPWPTQIRLSDINGDNVPEIILVGQSVANGSVANGIDDFQCLLIALDLHGRFLWVPFELEESLTAAYYDLIFNATTGDSDIVVATSSQSDSAGPQKVRRVSGSSGALISSFAYPRNFSGVQVMDKWASESPEIAVSTVDGKILVLDQVLCLVRKFDYSAAIALSLSSPVDIDNDGRLDLPVLSSDNSLLFLNSELESVASCQPVDNLGSIARARRRGGVGSEFLAKGALGSYLANASRVDKSMDEILPWSARIALISLAAVVAVREVYIRQRRKYYSFLEAFFKDDSRAVIGIDEKGRLFRMNSQARALLDIQHKRSNTLTLEDTRTGALLQAELPLRVSSFQAGSKTHDEFAYRGEITGRRREFLIQLVRPETGSGSRSRNVVILIQDVTEMSLARQFEVLSAVARGLAHDMKRPLTPIKLLLQDLGARFADGSLEVQKVREDYVGPAVRQIDQMARWIDRFRVFLSTGQNPRAKVRLNMLLEDIVVTKRSLVPRQVAIEFTPFQNEILIDGAREDLERAFGELVDNAHTALEGRESPRIVIGISMLQGDPIRAMVTVRDNGCGIASKDLPRVFDLDFSSRKEGHLGLGLATVRKIVHDHGGAIEISSEIGFGTEFAVILPMEAEEDTSGQTKTAVD